MTSCHPVFAMLGDTHASSVIPVVNANDAECGTLTIALVPLKSSALPNLPDAAHVALLMVPVLEWPDRSLTVVPDPSSKEYAAVRLGLVEAVVAVATFV